MGNGGMAVPTDNGNMYAPTDNGDILASPDSEEMPAGGDDSIGPSHEKCDDGPELRRATRIIFRAELRSEGRMFREMMTDHPVMAYFFLLLFLGMIYFTVAVMGFITHNVGTDGGSVISDEGSVWMSLFSLLIGRNAAQTLRCALKKKSIPIVMAQPMTRDNLMWGKIQYVVLSGLMFFGFTFSMLLLCFGVYQYRHPTDGIDFTVTPFVIVIAVELATIAAFTGFMTPLLLHGRKPAGTPGRHRPILIFGALQVLIFQTVFNLNFDPLFVLILAFLVVLSIIYIRFAAPPLFREALSMQYEGEGEYRLRTHTVINYLTVSKLSYFIRNRMAAIIAVKEIVVSFREKESYGSMMATAGLGIIFMLSYFFFPLQTGEGMENYIHPMMIVFGLYIAGLLMNAMLAISVVGHEGKALWILKSLPLRSRDVMHGKALSLVVTGIPAMAVVAVPYMAVSLPPWHVNVVVCALFLIVPLTFTGVGIAGGALFGSYGDDKGRSIAAQFIVMFVCMIMMLFVAGLPVIAVIEFGPRTGFITTIIVLFLSYNIYRLGIMLAASGFRKVDAEDFM